LKKRNIDVAVISDVHLGTMDCHAEELLAYLSSINPKKLILNGDIIDIWQFNKHYFPPSHLRILKKIISMASNGTEVIYITGNHDGMIRKFSKTLIGNISIRDKLILELDGKTAWFFHGDVFDIPIQHIKWFSKLGNPGFELLLQLNKIINWLLSKLGKEKYSLADKIKKSGKSAGKYVKYFERTASGIAIDKGYDYVVCGHIHRPKKEILETRNGKCTYLNSGDWVEHLSALEYSFKRWKIYNYSHDKLSPFFADEELKSMELTELISALELNRISKQNRKETEEKSIDL
jgi:UDP-2,3-diacylglucosamine pyrophosphatase LpxH